MTNSTNEERQAAIEALCECTSCMEDVAFAEYVINRLEARGFTIVKKETK